MKRKGAALNTPANLSAMNCPEFGSVGEPGNLAFIEADGSLRPGHGVYNEFCP